MALAVHKTYASGEVLTSTDLNASFSQIHQNAITLISPLTAALDCDGKELILDGDADTSIAADTDDRIDYRLGGVDLFVFNGTTVSSVNGLTLFGTATGTPAYIQANGSDANTGIDLRDANGNEMAKLAAVASAVNEVSITNAATGNRPRVAASGETNVGLALRPKGTGAGASVVLEDGNGNEVLICDVATASAVNEVTVTNAAAASNPAIKASGGDTNVGINLVPKGTGEIQYNGERIEAFAAGTKMLFQQTAAPTGWTKDTTHNDKALRVVTGAASSAGATAFTTVFGAGKSTASFTLTTVEIPAHPHNTTGGGNTGGGSRPQNIADATQTVNYSTDTDGGSGGGHSHTLSLDLQYVDVIVATKD